MPTLQKPKRPFGTAAKALPYTECSTEDGKAQTQVCIDKGIKSYPTWQFKDGTLVTGVETFAELAQKSGCPYSSVTASPPAPSIEVTPNETTVTTPIPNLLQ